MAKWPVPVLRGACLLIALTTTASAVPLGLHEAPNRRAAPANQRPPGANEPHFMVLMSTGCSGSSWVWSTLVKMIDAHHARNATASLPVMLAPTWGGVDPQVAAKEWLEPRFCLPLNRSAGQPDDGHGPVYAPSGCADTDQPTDVPAATVECEQGPRLVDAWRGVAGECSNGVDDRLTATQRQQHAGTSRPDARFVMPFSALFNQIDASGWAVLTPSNTRVAASVKRNALDQLICKVKDCFDKVTGVPVDASGNRRSECFDRRRHNLADADYKVKFDVSKFVSELTSMTTSKRATAWWHQANSLDLRGAPLPGPDAPPGSDGVPVSFGKPTSEPVLPGEYYEAAVEDLTAFEFNTNEESPEWQQSLDSWSSLLQSLGAEAIPEVMLSVFRMEVRHHDQPRTHHSHIEAIYNADEVKQVLLASPYAWMWRQ